MSYTCMILAMVLLIQLIQINYTKEICDLALGRMVDFMKKHLQ